MGNNYDWWRTAYPNNNNTKQLKSKKSIEKIGELNKKGFFEGYNKYQVKYLEYMVDNYPEFTIDDNQIESVEMVNIHEPFSVDEQLIYDDWGYFFGEMVSIYE